MNSNPIFLFLLVYALQTFCDAKHIMLARSMEKMCLSTITLKRQKVIFEINAEVNTRINIEKNILFFVVSSETIRSATMGSHFKGKSR